MTADGKRPARPIKVKRLRIRKCIRAGTQNRTMRFRIRILARGICYVVFFVRVCVGYRVLCAALEVTAH